MSYDAEARTLAEWGDQATLLTAYSCPSSVATVGEGDMVGSGLLGSALVAIRKSWILILRSTDPVAMRFGWYLFQSSERISPGCAGMESCGDAVGG